MDEMEELVPGAHRAVRRLDSAESPYAGTLVADGDSQRVRVDAARLDPVLWEFAGAEHVVGVRDVVREPAGQGALLPWCIEPVDVFLARRTAAERPLGAGEAVTLVGSLLRGTLEVGAQALTGRWWLDDRCRPLFAPGEGTTCAVASAALIERVRAECADRVLERALGRIGAGAHDHRIIQRSLDEWEAELTELAAPRALEREVHAPERVRAIPLHRAHLPLTGEEEPRRGRLRERTMRLGMLMLTRLRAGVPTRLRSQHGDGRRRTPSRIPRARADQAGPGRASRGRMLVIGGAAAAVVLLGGLLWPSADAQHDGPAAVAAETAVETAAGADDAARASEEASPPGDSADAAPGSSPAGETEEDAGEDAGGVEADRSGGGQDEAEQDAAHGDDAHGDDPGRAAVGLLSVIDRCRSEGDSACEEAVVAGSGPVVLDRLGPGASERDAVLVEDYGDVAVVRLAPDAVQGEQMLVLERAERGWLVRDVYDVADQPSDGR